MLAAALSIAWLVALWFSAAGIGRQETAVDRIRTVLVLGVAIPGVLGFVHLLYATTLWLAALLLASLGLLRERQKNDAFDIGLFITLGALFLILWPPISRPLLDGDSLGSHLPNAMAWLQRHSIWSASAPGWYYPPASELFAAGLLGAGGRWSLPLAGAAPALLLAGRIYMFARRENAPMYAAASVALALIFTPLFAFEAGTLQNDLWLTAFFVEILAASGVTLAAITLCSLLKPFGFLEAAIALIAARKSIWIYAVGVIPLLLWSMRDAILVLRGPMIPPGFFPPYWFTAIAGNLGNGMPEMARGFWSAAPQCFGWFAILAGGLLWEKTRRYALAGLAAFILYVFLPFSYQNTSVNYLLDGSSLRYMLPTFGAAALVAAVWASKMPKLVAIGAVAIAASGAVTVLGVFWNDAWTHRAALAALGAVAAAALIRPTRGLSAVCALLAIAVLGAQDAQVRAIRFYDDWMRTPTGSPTGVFTWLSRSLPRRIVAQNVRSGAILMVSPQTSTLEMPTPADGCATARRGDSLLFIGTNEGSSAPEVRRMFAQARACGAVIYEDGAAIVVRPTPK